LNDRRTSASALGLFVPDARDQELHGGTRRHGPHVKAQREDDARAAVHAPEEHADTILRRLREAVVP
jgi:hypothetical protein